MQRGKIPVHLFMVFLFLLTSKINANEMLYSEMGCFKKKLLTLADTLALALRNNSQIRSAELQRIVDKFSLEVARNQFLPQYSFDTSATYSNGTKPFYTTNPKVSFQTFYGTTLGVGLEDQVNAGRETAAVVEIIQPLLRGFGPQVTQASYKNALDQEIINRLDVSPPNHRVDGINRETDNYCLSNSGVIILHFS